MEQAIVNKIIPFSSVDGPGNRTVVFLQGCGFDCKYCHNPETINKCINCGKCVNYCKTGAISMSEGEIHYDSSKCVLCDECIHHCDNLASPRTKVMTTDEVIALIAKNVPFIRGLTVSGGECTRWRDFLVELFTKAKKLGLNTLLDSNGSYPFEKDEELMNVTDGVMLDVKAWNPTEHKALTGNSNEVVLDNFRYLLKANKLFEARTVVVPELMNAEETIDMVSKEIVKYSCCNARYKIIKYRDNGVRPEYKNIIPPEDEFLHKLRDIAYANGLTDIILI